MSVSVRCGCAVYRTVLGPHGCFWADEHVHHSTVEGRSWLGAFRRARTCAHGFSIRFDDYLPMVPKRDHKAIGAK